MTLKKSIINKILLSVIIFTFLFTTNITASEVSQSTLSQTPIIDDVSIDPYLDEFYKTPDVILPSQQEMQAYQQKIETGEITINAQNQIATEKIQRNLRELLLNEKTISSDPDDIFIKNNWQRLFQENPGLQEVLENSLKTNTLVDSNVENILGTLPLVGNYHIPVFLVDFPDISHSPNITPQIYYDHFNSPNYLADLDINAISVKEYIKHASYGMLDITFDIYGWKMLSVNSSYYAEGETRLPNAVLAAFDSEVDFSQYDHDNDGRIDGFIIVPAGDSSNGIANCAPICCDLGCSGVGASTLYDGKYRGNAAIISELITSWNCTLFTNNFGYPSDCRSTALTTIHEFMHVLGLPDLYGINPVTGQPDSIGGLYNVMSMMIQNSGLVNPMKPINLSAWPSFFLGWAQGIKILDQEVVDINSIDTYPITYIVQDPDKMYPKEFYIVSNRYIGGDSLDRDMFRWVSNPYNPYGGLDIYHVDENYISANVWYNSIMFDSDHNLFDDTISHPGIVFEQNKFDNETVSNPTSIYFKLEDLYAYIPIMPENETFDFVPKYYNGLTRDLTSKTYNGLQDTNVMVSAQSVSGPVITTYLQSTAPDPIIMELVSPISSSQYSLSDPISFIVWVDQSTIFAPEPKCVWAYNTTTISTDCNFTNTPQALNLPVGNVTLNLTVKDDYSNQTSTAQTTIEVLPLPLEVEITSPISGNTYNYYSNISFTETHNNNVGNVDCNWYYQGNLISQACNFTNSPYILGIPQGIQEITLKLKDSLGREAITSVSDVNIIECPLEVQITSPHEGEIYPRNQIVSFTETHQNAVGSYSCKWYLDDSTTPFNSLCTFQRTPEHLNMSVGSHTITLKLTDSYHEASDSVNIIIDYGVGIDPQGFLTAYISSPVSGSIFNQTEQIAFTAGYINNVGNISCKWYSDNQTNPISEQCNFTATPKQLGLTSLTPKTRVITLKIKDLTTLMQSTAISTITIKGMSVTPSQSEIKTKKPNVPIHTDISPVPIVIKDSNGLKVLQATSSDTTPTISSSKSDISKASKR